MCPVEANCKVRHLVSSYNSGDRLNRTERLSKRIETFRTIISVYKPEWTYVSKFNDQLLTKMAK